MNQTPANANPKKKSNILILFFLMFLSFVCGYVVQSFNSPSQSELPSESSSAELTVQELPPERCLRISAIVDEDTQFTIISSKDLGGNFDEDITYLYLKEVNVEIDGKAYPLEDAIRDGLISVEEIFAYARIDARNGICTEKYESKHGLAHFTYRYPEFDLRMTYDVFETPDGKIHLINDMGLYKVGSNVSTSYTDDETGEHLDREDWGITFEVAEVTPTSITLNCTQSGGQHIGELTASQYGIYCTNDGYEYVKRLDGTNAGCEFAPAVTIQQESTTQFTIDWASELGELDKGSYSLALNIFDIFDQSQVHPLMEDFHDVQRYWVPFTVS